MTTKLTARDILLNGPVIPVMVIEDLATALPLAQALREGGIKVLEITLRTPVALEAIALIAGQMDDVLVGAGTVANGEDLRRVTEAGAKFAISPGLTNELLTAAEEGSIPLIPGISTVSEMMLGMDHGLRHFKFFPAEAAGGPAMLKAISGPFPQCSFCPTGGISIENCQNYLQLPNVLCVGGSWLTPKAAINQQDWPAIRQLARQAAQIKTR